MHIHIISLFPEMFKALNFGIPEKAQEKGILTLHFVNPRDFAVGKHQRVDDRPYGGGPGMVMQVAPLQAAIQHALQTAAHCVTHPTSIYPKQLGLQAGVRDPGHRSVLPVREDGRSMHNAPENLSARSNIPIGYLSPQGKHFTHDVAYQLSQRTQLILVAGRYEGIDERVYPLYPREEWSLGDFVLSGGECAIMCMVDAICRLIPGVLGDPDSARQDSFSNGLLDYPHYTRPSTIANLSVPDILLSGDHKAIAHWRLKQSLQNTWLKRPDLLKNRILTPQEEVLLAEIKTRFPDDSYSENEQKT